MLLLPKVQKFAVHTSALWRLDIDIVVVCDLLHWVDRGGNVQQLYN